jgi:hypothetical protein
VGSSPAIDDSSIRAGGSTWNGRNRCATISPAEGDRTGDIRARLFRDPGSAVIALLEVLLAHMGDENIDELLHDIQLLLQRGMGRHVRFPPTGRIRDRRQAALLDREQRADGVSPVG